MLGHPQKRKHLVWEWEGVLVRGLGSLRTPACGGDRMGTLGLSRVVLLLWVTV